MTDPKLEARDPNTSPKRLAELLYGFTDDVLENPALPLVLLENPGWLNDAQIEPLLKLLLRPALPRYLVDALAQHHRPAIAANALMHVVLGEEVTDWEPLLKSLAALNCSKDDRVILEQYELIPEWLRANLAPVAAPKPARTTLRKPRVPVPLTEEQRQRLLANNEGELRRIARSSKLAEEVELLLEKFPEIVAEYAAANPLTPVAWLEKLLERKRCWFALVSNPAMTSELLSKLVDKMQSVGPDYVMDQVGFSSACTPELAKRLEGLRVREASLRRFRSNAELETLFLAGHSWAADEARTRSDAPAWLVAEGLMQEIQKRRAYLPWFCGLLALDDQKRLSKNVRSTNWFTRFAIAIHPGTQTKTLEKLTNDANRYVRFAVKARIADSEWSFANEVKHG